MAVEAEPSPSVPVAAVPTIDLDEGLEAALEDFGNDLPEAPAVEDSSVEEIPSEALVFEDAPIVEAVAEVSGVESIDVSDDGVLDGIELSPIEAGDSDDFDDVFVELIEE